MKNTTKKWLTVVGCLAICAVLVGLIGAMLRPESPKDEPLPIQSSQPGDVTVDPGTAEKEKEVVVTPPEIPAAKPGTGNSADDKGADQTIQGDVNKPEYTEDQLKDPTQKPNGDAVTEKDKPVEHDKVDPPKETPKPDNKPQGGDTSGGKIYIPGFGWIEDIGEGQGTTVDGDGDINKQVGTMS